MSNNMEYKQDFEELDEEETQINYWEKKQKELITSSVDYTLESISGLITKKAIDLSPKYQRRFRWDDIRKSKLIESFLMNVPIPPIFLNEDDYGKYSVIDGKQRLSSIHEFITGKLSLTGLNVFNDINDLTFFDLPNELQNALKTRANIRAIIVLRQSDKDVKFEVFNRLNTGGVRLNPQEIRNSTYPGILNDTLLDISESKDFHSLLGIKSKLKSALYREMKDVELILHYFAFHDNWKKYTGKMKYQLDNYMYENQNLSEAKLKRIRNNFSETLKLVKEIFGHDGAFRRWLPEKNKWKNQISAPIFDSQIFACNSINSANTELDKPKILRDFKKLFENDEEYLKSIQTSTTNPVNFAYRIQKLQEIMNKHSKEV